MCGEGKTALAEICVDGCDVVSKNSGSKVGFEQPLTKQSTCHELLGQPYFYECCPRQIGCVLQLHQLIHGVNLVRNVGKFQKLWTTKYFEIFVSFVGLHYGHYRLNECKLLSSAWAAIVEFDFQLLRFLVSKYCFPQLFQFALSKTYSPHVKSKRPCIKLKSVSD